MEKTKIILNREEVERAADLLLGLMPGSTLEKADYLHLTTLRAWAAYSWKLMGELEDHVQECANGQEALRASLATARAQAAEVQAILAQKEAHAAAVTWLPLPHGKYVLDDGVTIEIEDTGDGQEMVTLTDDERDQAVAVLPGHVKFCAAASHEILSREGA